MTKSIEKMNADRMQQMRDKENRLRYATFISTSNKNYPQKLDILVADIRTQKQELLGEIEKAGRETADELTKLNCYLDVLTDMMPELDKPELLAKVEAKVDQAFGRRSLGPEDTVTVMDTLMIDLTGYDESGAAHPQMSARNHKFTLNFREFIADVERGFLGMKVGESKSTDVTFPADYGVADLRGKTFKFDLHLISGKRDLGREVAVQKAEEQKKTDLIESVKSLGLESSGLDDLSLADLEKDVAALKSEFYAKDRQRMLTEYSKLTGRMPEADLDNSKLAEMVLEASVENASTVASAT